MPPSSFLTPPAAALPRLRASPSPLSAAEVLTRDGENLGLAGQADALFTTPRIGDEGDEGDEVDGDGINAALRLR